MCQLGLGKKYPWGFSGFQVTEKGFGFKEGGSLFWGGDRRDGMERPHRP